MNIGIIGAMKEEIDVILSEITIEKEEIKAGMNFKMGEFGNNKVILVVCGIGKVNAAICTQILIDDFKVNSIINVGVAGGLGENIKPGDIVIAENLVQHDMDTSFFGDKKGQIPRLDTFDFKCDVNLVEKAKIACKEVKGHGWFTGRIATGDQFMSEVEKIKWINSEFGAIACEMEGGSIAQTCYLNAVPFVVIRSISDNSLTKEFMDYEKFLPIAIKNSTNILKNMLLVL
ncbi:MAG: 5'-methylthioadenosine/adenosylhomocysteine nucleosidase [Clostridiaceae bacterium]|nr:5'-methylthioadenosine/adenosylhomocysteine nucleosidase [Clostridiaceae bacterium]